MRTAKPRLISWFYLTDVGGDEAPFTLLFGPYVGCLIWIAHLFSVNVP